MVRKSSKHLFSFDSLPTVVGAVIILFFSTAKTSFADQKFYIWHGSTEVGTPSGIELVCISVPKSPDKCIASRTEKEVTTQSREVNPDRAHRLISKFLKNFALVKDLKRVTKNKAKLTFQVFVEDKKTEGWFGLSNGAIDPVQDLIIASEAEITGMLQ